jgi:DNA-binding Lrp family transcriptional regulator
MVYAVQSVNAGRDARRSNTAVVLGLVLRAGPISVRAISEEVGLSKVTTHAILAELVERDLIEVARRDHARRGPAAALYAARGDAAYAISASVDAEAAVAECVDLRGVSRPTARIEGADPIDGVVRAIREVTRKTDGVVTIVVGLPYSLHRNRGRCGGDDLRGVRNAPGRRRSGRSAHRRASADGGEPGRGRSGGPRACNLALSRMRQALIDPYE